MAYITITIAFSILQTGFKCANNSVRLARLWHVGFCTVKSLYAGFGWLVSRTITKDGKFCVSLHTCFVWKNAMYQLDRGLDTDGRWWTTMGKPTGAVSVWNPYLWSLECIWCVLISYVIFFTFPPKHVAGHVTIRQVQWHHIRDQRPQKLYY